MPETNYNNIKIGIVGLGLVDEPNLKDLEVILMLKLWLYVKLIFHKLRNFAKNLT